MIGPVDDRENKNDENTDRFEWNNEYDNLSHRIFLRDDEFCGVNRFCWNDDEPI